MLPEGLRLARYRVTVVPEQPLRQPRFFGATLRGGFGYAFKRLVCLQRDKACSECLLRSQCAYSYVFETSPPPGSEKLRNLSDIPRPFVLEPPSGDQVSGVQVSGDGIPSRDGDGAGDGCQVPGADSPLTTHHSPLAFTLVLIGRALDYLPYFVLTLVEFGKRGLGRDLTPFTVCSVDALPASGDPVEVYTAASQTLLDHDCTLRATDLEGRAEGLRHPFTPSPAHPFTVVFLSPTRIEQGGRALETIEFHQLVRALLRRLSSLCYFHCGCELDVDYRGLIAKAEQVCSDASGLRWVAQHRRSTKQDQELKISGFVGPLLVEGDLSDFLPLLVAGELVHVGKGTVMGMGRYEVCDRIRQDGTGEGA